MIKRIFPWFFIIILLALSVFAYIYFESIKDESFCSTPITYTIGKIDDRFKISQDELKDITGSASKIWSNTKGSPLFVYDQNSTLDINMVYSEAHTILRTISNDESTVNNEQLKLTESLVEYEKKRKALQSKIDRLNSDIKSWNDRGGATQEEFDKIKQKNQDIKSEIESFNAYSNALNLKSQDYNFDVSKLNDNITKFNDRLQENPEMGVYVSGDNKIEIYFYENKKDLENVIAHELGHALGLDHIIAADAIMNPQSSPNTHFTKEDADLLADFCKNNTKIDRIKFDIQNFAYPYRILLEQKIKPNFDLMIKSVKSYLPNGI